MDTPVAGQPTFPVGTVLRGHGLKGEVKIDPQLEDLEALKEVQTLTATYPDGGTRELKLDRIHINGGKVLMTFAGIGDRTGADALRGVALSVARDQLPALAEGEYYLGDLAGYTVFTDDQVEIGPVQEVWDLPANEVLRVLQGEREVLIPLVDEVIRDIDHAGRRIVITPMEGLLD